jgi:L-ascorbate metabolism protein UlaG (beta-lactamase superfamily)
MNTGGCWDFVEFKVKCVVAQHSSSLPDGSYCGNPMGFVIQTNEGNFYYSGDTAVTMDMQFIPKWAKLNFAVLPIGDNFTMGYEDAVLASELIQCKQVIGVHYDTFDLIRIDRDKAREHFEKAGLALQLPKIGETITI